MKKAIVSGYASLDFAVGLAGYYKTGHTTVINDRSSNPWPHPGVETLPPFAPLTVAPFHFKPATSYVLFGPYAPFFPPRTIELLCVDVTGGAVNAVSPLTSILVQ